MMVNQYPSLLVSNLPERTDLFYGREKELQEIREVLDPSRPGRKSILLCGIGGSGKTQLSLRHIYQDGRRYSAILWIDASTKERARLSFAEAADAISSSWPCELPPLYGSSDADNTVKVTARLRSTRYNKWLLVIDSAEDIEQDEFLSYIPACEHGSILVTSTRYQACSRFKPGKPLAVDGLDPPSSMALLVARSERPEMNEDGTVPINQLLIPVLTIHSEHRAARDVVKELSGIPLAVEQAGALIRDGEFSFSDFLSTYKADYRRLMENAPQDGFWSYEKNRVLLTILDMIYHRSVQKNPTHASLLNFIGVLGSWQIPVSLLERFQFFDASSPNPIQEDLERLKDLLNAPNFLRMALRQLARLCLITLREEQGHIKSFIMHRVLCQWCLENVIAASMQDYIIQATYGLARDIFDPKVTSYV